MLKCVPKIITGVLAISCLSLAAVNARLMMDTSSSVELNIPSLNIPTKIAQNNTTIIKTIEQKIDEVKVEKKVIEKKVSAPKKVIVKSEPAKIAAKDIVLKTEHINFDEPVKLQAVKVEYSLPSNLVALAPNFEYVEEKVMVAEVNEEKVQEAPKAEVLEDKISTTLAAQDNKVIDEEPVFFDYPAAKEEMVQTVAAPIIVEEVTVDAPVLKKADYEKMADEFLAFDYSAKNEEVASNNNQTITNIESDKKTEKTHAMSSEKVATKLAKVTTQKKSVEEKEEKAFEQNTLTTQKKMNVATVMSIQAAGTNLKKVQNVKNYEIRFQDDLNEIYEDYGSGEVQFTTKTNKLMTRSMVVLKRGYAPTNTDLIIENNAKVTLPLIEEQLINEMLDQNDKSSAVGALLVEYDEETETVLLDVDYSHEITLDKNLKKTSTEEFTYKLFVGVPAGNIFVKYQRFDGSEAAKIVHIHEREVTFDANLYEEAKAQEVEIYEEGLLSKELSPLITTGDKVRVFATEITARKLNQNTYKLNKKRSLLAERHYLEVNHQDEPIFVGHRDTNKVILPSENFIKFVLSKFEDNKLGNRCIIQVNIDAPVASYHVGTESVGNNLVTSSQVLDQDGKFYDSVGPKSTKIIILGENYAQEELSRDGKVNIKIDYLNGTSRYLSSYCSPNTYLVEQL